MTKFFLSAWLLSSVLISLITYFSLPIKKVKIELKQPVYILDKLNSRTVEREKIYFIDNTLQAGILSTHSQKTGTVQGVHESLGAGVCSFDYNLDGWLDLVVLIGTGNTHYYGHKEWWQSSKYSLKLYENKKNGTFKEVSEVVGLKTDAETIGCSVGDLDSDGYLDLFLANRGENELWKNLNGKHFEKINNFLPNSTSNWTTSASIADLNNDNKPDIYLTNYLDFKPNSLTFEATSGFKSEKNQNFDTSLHSGIGNALLINNGDFEFVEQAKVFGVDNSQGRSLSAKVFDINADGKLDIYVANGQNSENKLFINDGLQSFIDRSTQKGIGSISVSTGITPFSISGEKALFQTSGTTNYNRIFAISNLDKLEDATDKLKLKNNSKTSDHSWPPAIADFNGDTTDDILVSNGLLTPNDDAKSLSQNQFGYLLLNTKDGFLKQSKITQKAPKIISSTRCAISGDFNNDGSPDALVAVNNGLPQLLINQLKPESWLGLILVEAFQSDIRKIVLKTNLKKYDVSIVNGTNGFCWQDNSRVIFPLAVNEDPKEVTIFARNSTYSIKIESHKNRYIRIMGDEIDTILGSSSLYESKINLNSINNRLSIIDFLIRNKNFNEAYSEIAILKLDESNDITNQINRLSELIENLPKTYQIRLAPKYLSSSIMKEQKLGIGIAKRVESNLLARWLFPLIGNDNHEVACSAINTVNNFFAEEEAMTLTKYASLTKLIKTALKQDESSICAIKALGEAEKFRAVAPLVSLLSSSDEETRKWLIQSLGRIREGDAFIAIKERLFDLKETRGNKLEALSSLFKINNSFDVAELIETEYSFANRSVLLNIAALATSDQSHLSIKLKQRVREAVLRKFSGSIDGLETSDLINYFVVINDDKAKLALKKISNDYELKYALKAFKALFEIDSESRAENLTKILELDSEFTIRNDKSFRLTVAEFESVVKMTNRQDFLKYLSNKLQPINAEKYVISHLDNLDREIDSVLLNLIFQSPVVHSSKKLCKSLLTSLESMKGKLSMLNLLNSRPILFEKCSNENNERISSRTLSMLIEKSEILRQQAVRLLFLRNDRSTRDLILNLLKDDAIEISAKKLIVAEMPSPLTKSRIKALEESAKMENDLGLFESIYIKLASNKEWLFNNEQYLMDHLNKEIDSNNYDKALTIAKLLFPLNPSDTIKHFVSFDSL